MSKEPMPTELTADQLNHWAAETVMGWKIVFNVHKEIIGYEKPDGTYIYSEDWSPATDRNHLAMVLDKLNSDDGHNVARAFDTGWPDFDIWAALTSPPETILRAVYEVLNDEG